MHVSWGQSDSQHCGGFTPLGKRKKKVGLLHSTPYWPELVLIHVENDHLSAAVIFKIDLKVLDVPLYFDKFASLNLH